MPLNCPKCRTMILADDVNIQALVAVCRQCHEVFRVTDYLPDAPKEAAKLPAFPRPATIVVLEEDGIQGLRWRWFRASYFGLLFFCIAWDSFLVFWYALALGGVMRGAGGFEWLAVIFPVCHVAVGVALSYFTLAGFLNKTTLVVTDDRLIVKHHPIPWFGNKALPKDELREVYAERGSTESSNGRQTRQNYSIAAVTDDGNKHKLMGGLEWPEAQFGVQKINEWCGLAVSRLGLSLTDTD